MGTPHLLRTDALLAVALIYYAGAAGAAPERLPPVSRIVTEDLESVDRVLGAPVTSPDRFTKSFKIAGVTVSVGGNRNTPSGTPAAMQTLEYRFPPGAARTWQDAVKRVGLDPSKGIPKRVRAESGWTVQHHWSSPKLIAWWVPEDRRLVVTGFATGKAAAPTFPTLDRILKHRRSDMNRLFKQTNPYKPIFNFGSTTLQFEWTDPPESAVKSVRIPFRMQPVKSFADAARTLGLDPDQAVQTENEGKSYYRWESQPGWGATWDQATTTIYLFRTN